MDACPLCLLKHGTNIPNIVLEILIQISYSLSNSIRRKGVLFLGVVKSLLQEFDLNVQDIHDTDKNTLVLR